MISKSLIKSSFIYTVIGALPLASAFFLLPFYTDYLSESDFGLFALYLTFTTFIQILANFGIDTYIGINYFEHKDNVDALQKQIGILVGYLLLLGAVLTLGFLISGEGIFKVVFGNNGMQFFPFGIMSVMTAIFNSIFKTYTNLLINQQRPTRFLVVNLANFVMTIGFSLGGLFMFPNTLIGPMWGRLLSGIGIFIIAIYFFSKEFKIRLHFGEPFKNAFAFSAPVLVFFLLSWLTSNADRYVINYFMTTKDIAIFDFGVKCTLLAEFLLNGVSSAFMPKVFLMIKNKNLTGSTVEFNKYFSSYTAISLLSILFLTFIIPLVLPVIVEKRSYYQSFLFIALLNIGFITRPLYNYFLTPVYFFKRTKVLPNVLIVNTIFQFIILIPFIKYFGLWGAVWASLITKISQIILLYFGARNTFCFKFNVVKMIILPCLVIATIAIGVIYAKPENIHIIHGLQLLITIFLVALVYRNEIIYAINLLRKKDT